MKNIFVYRNIAIKDNENKKLVPEEALDRVSVLLEEARMVVQSAQRSIQPKDVRTMTDHQLKANPLLAVAFERGWEARTKDLEQALKPNETPTLQQKSPAGQKKTDTTITPPTLTQSLAAPLTTTINNDITVKKKEKTKVIKTHQKINLSQHKEKLFVRKTEESQQDRLKKPIVGSDGLPTVRETQDSTDSMEIDKQTSVVIISVGTSAPLKTAIDKHTRECPAPMLLDVPGLEND